jgi:hypothetical protein
VPSRIPGVPVPSIHNSGSADRRPGPGDRDGGRIMSGHPGGLMGETDAA